jgi:predicted tellurium resistance membrane protein TerC
MLDSGTIINRLTGMRNIIIFGVVLAVLGLLFGYLVFGKIAGEYVSVKTLFASSSGSVIKGLVQKVIGITTIRRNILISGGVGLIAGVILGAAFAMKKR